VVSRACSDAPTQPQGFGYTRADAIILSVGIPVAGFGAYAALEARRARTRFIARLAASY